MQQRTPWFDIIRLLAMFMVIACHCTDPFNFYPGTEPANIDEIKWWGATYGALLRPCVPLFVMLTGALLLPVKGNAAPFYRKRINRIVWPFLLWSVLYALFPWFTGLLNLEPETILIFFPYSGEEAMRQSLSVSLGYIGQIPMNFSVMAVHMWYIYLLIGLYLYMPIFSSWIEKVSERAKLYFLTAWGITLFIPYFREFISPYFWGSCSWNEFSALYYFAGFNGYLLLGHYLKNHIPSLKMALSTGIPLFIIGFAITFMGFRYMTTLPECTPEQMELFFYYCSPNVLIMTIPLFMIIANIRITSPKMQALLKNFTTCGFGIYMTHYFFTGPAISIMRWIELPIGMQIPVGSIVSLLIAWLLVVFIRRITGKYARYIVG